MPGRFETATLKARLAEGRHLALVWCALGSVPVVEAAWDAGAEAVVIDLQHGLFDRAGMESAIGSAPRGAPSLVRTEDASIAAIGRALDAGAEGILVPLVETAAEAAAIVAACHYPPRGGRSGGGMRPLGDIGTYLAWADRAVTVGVMIESEAAAGRAAEITGVPGLDLIFVGTGDLALTIGRGPDAAARVEAALTRVREACAAAGIASGLFTLDRAASDRRRAEGWGVTVYANDITVLRGGFAAAVQPVT